MSQHLLFVCSANVCRSPLMAITFADAVVPGFDHSEWSVTSGGTSVARKHAMCDLAASLTVGGSAASHTSAQVSESTLENQALVIVASRDERARLARMLPSSRTRTFTLKEALALGAPDVAPWELDRIRRARPDGEPSLTEYAALLHQRRGRVPVEPSPRARMPWTKSLDPQDIPDVHHENHRKHASTLIELRALVRTLHGRMGEYFAGER